MGHNNAKARPFRHLNRFERFRHCADLIKFDKDRVRNSFVNPPLEALWVCHEKIIPYKLNLVTKPLRENLPAIPVILGETILDSNNGEISYQPLIKSDHLLRGLFRLILRLHHVFPVHIELACRGIHGQIDILSRLIPRFLNRLNNQFKGLAVGRKIRRKSPFISNRGDMSLIFQDLFEVMKNL